MKWMKILLKKLSQKIYYDLRVTGESKALVIYMQMFRVYCYLKMFSYFRETWLKYVRNQGPVICSPNGTNLIKGGTKWMDLRRKDILHGRNIEHWISWCIFCRLHDKDNWVWNTSDKITFTETPSVKGTLEFTSIQALLCKHQPGEQLSSCYRQ